MKILSLLKSYLLYAGLTKEEFEYVRDDVVKSNKSNLKIFSLIICVAMAVLMITANFHSVANANFWYYFGEAIITLALYLISKFLLKDKTWLVPLFQYLFIVSILVFSILIGTVTSIQAKMVVYPAFLLLVPLLFTDRPIKLHLFMLTSLFLCVILGINFKDDSIFSQDLLNIISFYFASVIITIYIQKVKYNNFAHEYRLSILSDIDVLTNLQNRNCYEKNIQLFENDEHEMAKVIYIDVNGLHEINNRFGHDAGDTMLKYISSEMKDIFGFENCYRIGGDEFVVLYTKEFITDIESRISTFKNLIEKKKYFVSIGYDFSDSHVDDMTVLVKKAEDLMYKDKKEFYQENNQIRNAR